MEIVNSKGLKKGELAELTTKAKALAKSNKGVAAMRPTVIRIKGKDVKGRLVDNCNAFAIDGMEEVKTPAPKPKKKAPAKPKAKKSTPKK